MRVKTPWKRISSWRLSHCSYYHFLICEAHTHWYSLSGRELISIGKCCLLIFPAEVGASFILGDKTTSVFSDSLNRFLGLHEAAARLWGIICVSPGCGLQEWSLWAEASELWGEKEPYLMVVCPFLFVLRKLPSATRPAPPVHNHFCFGI